MTEKLKFAFWRLREKWAEWRLYREIGGGDAKKGRRIFRMALAQVTLEEVLTCMEYETDGMTAAAIEQHEEEWVDWHLGGRPK